MIKGLPMLTHAFLKWIVEQDTKNKTMLEFGSGASTLFFSNIFKNVKSLECNEKYRLSLEKEMPKNVELYDLNFNLFPQILKDVDYVLIDNDVGPGSKFKREEVAQNLIEKFNYKNITILDNGNWNPQAYFYLKYMYEQCEDFGWSTPWLGEETITSVFSERRKINERKNS